MSEASGSKRSSRSSSQRPPPNERIYLQLYDYETKEFSGLTTYHGLVRIYNSNTWPSRIFWCVVVLSCLSLFMIHSGLMLQNYHSKPTLTQVNVIVPHNGLDMPAITVCNYNPVLINKTRFFYPTMRASVLEYVLKAYLDDVDDSREEIEYQHELYLNYTYDYERETGEAFDLVEFFNRTGSSCEDLVVGCWWSGDWVEDCCKLSEPLITDMGKCFRFSNREKKRKQWFSGSTFGWQMLLNTRNEQRPDQLPDEFADIGIKMLVHEERVFPLLRSNGVSVPPGTSIYAALDVRNVARLADGVPACTPLQLFNCSKNTNDELGVCSCDVECHRIEYDIQMSYTNLVANNELHKRFALDNDKDYIKNNFAMVNVFMREISYEEHIQQKQMQTADLLSNIAGSMGNSLILRMPFEGLFLGMSTVTLLEIFIFLFKSVWGTVNTERQQQFHEAMLAEEEADQQDIMVLEEEDVDDSGVEAPDAISRRDRRSSTQKVVVRHIHIDRRGSDRSFSIRRPSSNVAVTPTQTHVNYRPPHTPSHLLSPSPFFQPRHSVGFITNSAQLSFSWLH